MAKYLVKITIPSVQDVIVRSRKLKDLTGGSKLIPTVMKAGLKRLENDKNVEFIIPTSEIVKGNDLNITNVAYLTIEGEIEQVVQKVKDMKEEMLKQMNELVSTVKHRIPDKEFNTYENLINYQIKNAINVVWAISEIKDNDILKAKEDIDIAVANAKSSIEPDDIYIEGFNLIQKQKNQYTAFEDYQDFIEKATSLNPELLKGAYLCEMCGKRVILGATEKNFKNSITEKEEEDRLCAFCYAKRHYHGDYKKSVVDVAIEKYFTKHGSKIKEIFKKYNKTDLLNDDIQNVYVEVLEKNGENPELIKSLKDLYQEIGRPPVYYAILVMDGDSMGEKISKAFKENKIKIITEKLSQYGKKASDIVKESSGMVIYVGGDDVLAIFPLETALDGYKKLVEAFKESMKDTGYDFTASAGLLISHYKIPLSYVLQESRLAESKAKKVDGKDTVYIKYIKHSFSSAETPVKNEHLQFFDNLINFLSDKDFPYSFIYQLQELLLPYLPKTETEQPVKELTRYLIEKKPYKRAKEFEKFILDTPQLINFKEPERIINTLKVAKFIATEVQYDRH